MTIVFQLFVCIGKGVLFRKPSFSLDSRRYDTSVHGHGVHLGVGCDALFPLPILVLLVVVTCTTWFLVSSCLPPPDNVLAHPLHGPHPPHDPFGHTRLCMTVRPGSDDVIEQFNGEMYQGGGMWQHSMLQDGFGFFGWSRNGGRGCRIVWCSFDYHQICLHIGQTQSPDEQA